MKQITDFNMNYFSLKGKNAVVTGGNTGLGQAFSLALAKAGANIFMPSVMPDDPEFNKLIEAEGGKAYYMEADITKPGVPKMIAEKALEAMGSVDILINCAGICPCEEFENFGRELWDKAMDINLTGAFEVSYEFAKAAFIPQKHGKIINICSLFSFLGCQMSPVYVASKHGLAGLTKAYADELGKYNVQVNGIAPGYFKTKAAAYSANDPVLSQRIVDHTPANRWGEVHDLMGATVFLASEASEFVNGHVLAVDGGYLIR